jgi:hypothetical protein
MAAAPPQKKLRLDRMIMLVLLLVGIGAGVYLLLNR